jgi:hypothetical protein
MPGEHRTDEDAPHDQTQPKLHPGHRRAASRPAGNEADHIEKQHAAEINPQPISIAFQLHVERVAQQVARESLIVVDVEEVAVLDHQPTAVAPEEVHQRAVRIGLLVGMLVVNSMHRHPTRRSILQRANAENGERMLEPFRRHEPLVREQSVVA